MKICWTLVIISIVVNRMKEVGNSWESESEGQGPEEELTLSFTKAFSLLQPGVLWLRSFFFNQSSLFSHGPEECFQSRSDQIRISQLTVWLWNLTSALISDTGHKGHLSQRLKLVNLAWILLVIEITRRKHWATNIIEVLLQVQGSE